MKTCPNSFERDILKLKNEISSYADHRELWSVSGTIANSGGNLCLHLLGNLQYYIGHVLGGSGYIRDRPAEFSRKNIAIQELISEIEHTREIVAHTIRSLPEQKMDQEYPEKVFEDTMKTGYFLVHLLAHLNYHVGQINYHRRLMDKQVN